MKHFIVLRDHKLGYGRVPKVANTSVKDAIARLILDPKEIKGVTRDAFWRNREDGKATMVSARELAERYPEHFVFSFVRHPFDRLVSCYQNKVMENDFLHGPMQKMGIELRMPFEDFVRVVAATPDAETDLHLRSQTAILCDGTRVVPQFVGRYETLEQDWTRLQGELDRRGLPLLGRLPKRNVRRTDKSDVPRLLSDPALERTLRRRYAKDFEVFYPDDMVSV
jgi:dermatan 4-sulfotransferase 1